MSHCKPCFLHGLGYSYMIMITLQGTLLLKGSTKLFQKQYLLACTNGGILHMYVTMYANACVMCVYMCVRVCACMYMCTIVYLLHIQLHVCVAT